MTKMTIKRFWKLAGRICPDGDVRPLMREVVNHCAAARGLPAAWETDMPGAAVKELGEALASFGGLSEWGAHEFGSLYTASLPPDVQKEKGSFYTPPEVADFMVRFALGIQIDRLARHPDPGNVLQVLATDPSCGAGVFLVSAARYVASRYVRRTTGLDEPAALLIRQALPEVLNCCVFGVDTDPIAVDLSRSVLWLELDGEKPITFMDRNVICGNVLEGDLPPRLAEIYPNPEDAFADASGTTRNATEQLGTEAGHDA
jgi:hypothetical protein